MNALKTIFFTTTVLTGLGLGLVAAVAQPSTYDPAQLPETKGKVAQYLLNPMGMVDGLLLADGTEIHVPPFVSTQLVFAVRPGDVVTVHGLKARALPMVAAASVTNDATGATVQAGPPPRMREAGPPNGQMGEHMNKMHERMGIRGTPLELTGTVKAALHNPRGETDGVVLADGSQVRLSPPEAKRLGDTLAPGKTLTVKGQGTANLLGKVVIAQQIGPDATHLVDVYGPRGRTEEHGGMMGHFKDMMQHRPPAPPAN